MKVLIQTDKFKGGPAVFRSRLILALKKYDDIEVINDVNKNFDIEVAFIRKTHKHNKPYILRVDGCYYQKDRRSGNKGLEESIINSNYLIFQSQFSFDLCKKILDIHERINKKKYSIIHNGIDLDYIKNIEPSKEVKCGSFVSAARWRDNKRSFSILNGFVKAKTGRHLYMIGGVGIGEDKKYFLKLKEYEKKYNYIHFLGEKTEEETISILKACEYQIHLCHIDSCPNIVLEGLSCGLNVLCTNLGGTKELVRNDGFVLDVDKMWEDKYLSSSIKLDSLSEKDVAKGIIKLMELKTKPDIYRFNMDNVVDQYVKIIRENA